MMEETILSTNNLSKYFYQNRNNGNFLSFRKNKKQKVLAVNNISLNINRGETLGIIGSNGSGKTTLAKTIAGIYRHNSGDIKANGTITYLSGMSNGFNAKLSVRDNIYLVASIFGLKQDEIKAIFDEIINFADLEEQRGVGVFQLSNGTKKRLGFSIVIHCLEKTNPDIIILDEVLSGGGDEKFKKQATTKIEKMITSQATVVLISHKLDTIEKFCNRTAWMENGEIKKIGKSEDVVNLYLNISQ